MFRNRENAANKLGIALEKFLEHKPLVLGIPRGGIEIGYHVARHLNCDFNAIIVRKLGYPQQPEAAFGTLAEDGSLYFDPWSNKYLTKEIIEKVIKREKKEIKRRVDAYRNGKELPDLEHRVVILVDDGIATGATVFAAINMCRNKKAKEIVVAVPVSGVHQITKLQALADEVIILEVNDHFFAVSQGYQEFVNLSDREVTHLMDMWRKKVNQN